MSEQKKCQPGEWWEYNDARVYIAGITSNGRLICEYKDGTTGKINQGSWWKHLPECTGFDWQPPDWVTQDCLPARPGIDQRRWVKNGEELGKANDWMDCDHTVRSFGEQVKHGFISGGNTLELRCLRKDLPPVQEVWPKYYETTVPGELAFLRRDTATGATYVLIDGTEGGAIMWSYADDSRKELTESEALARIVKPVDAEAPSRDVIEQMAEHEDCVSVGGMAADAGLPVASRIDLMAMIKEANEMLRSAYAVAEREGGCTNWEAFRNRLNAVLEQQHRVMFPKSVSGTSKTCVMCNGPADLTDDSCKQCYEFAIEQVCGVRPDLKIFMTVDGILYAANEPQQTTHKRVRIVGDGVEVMG